LQNTVKNGLRIEGAIGRETPPAPDLLEVIKAQAGRTPDKAAVEFEDVALTYAELDRITDRLGSLFRSRGVGPSSRVAVAMPRGLGEYVSFLAILKAGGAFVPIDVNHPKERIQLVLEDAEPQALVAPSSSPFRESLPEGAAFIALDRPLSDDIAFEGGPLDSGRDPRQLAYILFTSGSTGRPKGVAIPRGAISNFLHSVASEPGLAGTERLAAVSTTTFDMSELDFFLPLYVGATVVIADRSTVIDPYKLRAFLEARRITVMQATPTTWRMLLDAGWTGHPGFKMFTGGEAISTSLAERLLTCGAELWNMYGPTETTVYSTLERVLAGAGRMTIGLPIENTQISIRDAEGRPLPPETVGEICIGGRGLAIGYYGRPDLTADRFPTDPESGERYYRTGDFGRWLEEGKLECLGRIDHQIKIRGFRIEPADIEAHLRSVAGVQEVLVVGRKQGEDLDPQLVAYWVGSASREDLYRSAKDRLPPYMVPSAYVRVESFPLTTSGKVDRNKLPSPESASFKQRDEFGQAPRNDRESIVAGIWREVLDLPFVPVDVDFFSLGGTSIRAVQVQRKAMSALGVDLPLSVLYEHPTVEGIVSRLDAPSDPDAPVISMLGKGSDPAPWIGLMGIQLFQDLAQEMAGSHSVLGIHIPAMYVPGKDAFPTVQELARRYLAVIKQRQQKGPYFLLGLCHGGVVAFEAAAMLEEQGEEVGLVVLLDAELPQARRSILAKRLFYSLRDAARRPRSALARAARAIFRKKDGERPSSQAEASSAAGRAIDVLEDNAAVDADLLKYEALGRRVSCEVMAFRATKSEVAPWLVVSPDLGWSGRAGGVSCHDVASSHLGIVRPPHAADVARLMTEARLRVEGGRKEGSAQA
jgi:amino acid adenylation domain-containing protein